MRLEKVKRRLARKSKREGKLRFLRRRWRRCLNGSRSWWERLWRKSSRGERRRGRGDGGGGRGRGGHRNCGLFHLRRYGNDYEITAKDIP